MSSLGQFDGFPLKVQKVGGETVMVVTKIERKPLDEHLFAIPPEYQKIDMSGMGRPARALSRRHPERSEGSAARRKDPFARPSAFIRDGMTTSATRRGRIHGQTKPTIRALDHPTMSPYCLAPSIVY